MANNFMAEHPWYAKRKSIWRYNLASLAGGRAMVDGGYLDPSAIEGEASFDRRKRRSMRLYKNLLRSGLRIYEGQIFRIEPVRVIPERISGMVDDVDLQGTDAQPFFASVTSDAQVTGQSYVLVDSPALPPGTTQMQAQQGRLRPYFEHVPTLALIDWEVETLSPARRGQLNYAVIADEIYAPTASPFALHDPISRIRVWTTDEWFVFTRGAADATHTLDSQGSHSLGRVPLVPFYDQRIAPMQGQTISDDIALQADALWQYRSVRDESLYIHGIQQLVLSSDSDDIKELDFSASRAIPIGANDTLDYLRPSEVVYSAYSDVATEIIEDVADLIFARSSRQLPTGQVESADKRRSDREEFVAILEEKASNFEESEAECWRLANLWAGGTDGDEISVAYNRDYESVDTLADEWVQRIAEGVASRVEWYQEIHPGVSTEDAAIAVAANAAQRGSPVRDVLNGLV